MDKIELSSITINIWGIFVSLGFVAGIALALDFGKRKGISARHIWNIALIAVVCGIFGSRLLYVLENWREFYGSFFLIFDLMNKPGLSFFGGFILSAAGIYFYARFYRLLTLQTFDLLIVPLLAGMSIGRAGCFMAHDHLPAGKSVWLDPALFLMLTNFVLFLIFLIFRDKIKKQGILAILFLTCISLSRLIWDYLRADPRYWGMTVAQWVSIIILCTIFILVGLIKYEK